MQRDKERPFSGVTSSGRVWRKVPESEIWSVCTDQTTIRAIVSRGTKYRHCYDFVLPRAGTGTSTKEYFFLALSVVVKIK